MLAVLRKGLALEECEVEDEVPNRPAKLEDTRKFAKTVSSFSFFSKQIPFLVIRDWQMEKASVH